MLTMRTMEQPLFSLPFEVLLLVSHVIRTRYVCHYICGFSKDILHTHGYSCSLPLTMEVFYLKECFHLQGPKDAYQPSPVTTSRASPLGSFALPTPKPLSLPTFWFIHSGPFIYNWGNHPESVQAGGGSSLVHLTLQ